MGNTGQYLAMSQFIYQFRLGQAVSNLFHLTLTLTLTLTNCSGPRGAFAPKNCIKGYLYNYKCFIFVKTNFKFHKTEISETNNRLLVISRNIEFSKKQLEV